MTATARPRGRAGPARARTRNRRWPALIGGLVLAALKSEAVLKAHHPSRLAAGIASLRRTDQLPGRREQVIRARRALCDPRRSTAMRAIPSDANFVLLDLGGAGDVEVSEALARPGILVRAGSEFGLPG
jgi:histidinol-phosphate/aromatic aminotransferase/cobyric acid decarboxylase-like protein